MELPKLTDLPPKIIINIVKQDMTILNGLMRTNSYFYNVLTDDYTTFNKIRETYCLCLIFKSIHFVK